MKKMRILLILLAGLFLNSCTDNNQSFFIEHSKVLPDPPDCAVSIGDEHTHSYTVNLFSATIPRTSFLVRNNIMKREDFGTLSAESNGILVDSYDLVISDGGSEQYILNHYIEPEGQALLNARLLSYDHVEDLRQEFSCKPMSPGDVRDAILSNNLEVLAELNQAQNIVKDVISTVQFKGKTQGGRGKSVETQPFSVTLHVYCGIRGGWDICFSDWCHAFCNPTASYPEACYHGMNEVMTCSDFLASLNPNIEVVDPETEETIEVNLCNEYCRN